MKSFTSICIVFLIVLQSMSTHAGEGMWLPLYIKKHESKMKEMGLKISPEDVYSVNNSSMKDAIVSLGGFCTAEFVSESGLLFTNHHCAYDRIAEQSSVENDYLEDGFWASSQDEELANPGLTATRLVRMEDVTKDVKSALDTVEKEMTKQKVKQKVFSRLKEEATEDTHYDAEIKSMYHGNEYYMMIHETFKDVRLVGAPPEDIGKFGGDTDNWMWPRHTSDFAVFRVYTGPDGKPAEYSEDNIPYEPKEHLEISLNGYAKDSFSMIFGFPGSTERYLTSYDIKHKMDIEQPTLIDIFDRTLNTMKAKMDADKEAEIEMASDYASLSNYHKYLKGQLKGLRDYDLVGTKEDLEKNFMKWVNQKPDKRKQYAEILPKMKEAYKQQRTITPGFYYLAYSILNSDLFEYAYQFSKLESSLKNAEEAEDGEDAEDAQMALDKTLAKTKEQADQFFSNSFPKMERKIFREILTMYAKDAPANQRPEFINNLIRDMDGQDTAKAVRSYLADIYNKSFIFDNKTFLMDSIEVDAFLDDPQAKDIEKDPLVNLYGKLLQHYRSSYIPKYRQAQSQKSDQLQLYMEGLRKWKEDQKFYPNANSTMRISYGKIDPYRPEDAVYYDYFTTHKGIMQKKDPNDEEFDIPDKLDRMIQAKKFGRYGEGDTLKLCFLTDNDITGGNSGSPVLNGKGNLIGIAFDGNWESMTGDLVIDPKVNRTINVDIRYVLWVIDEFANAEYIMQELDIVEDEGPNKQG